MKNFSCDEKSKKDASKEERNECLNASVRTSADESEMADPRDKNVKIRGDRNKEKLKICTDPSEIKPLLNGSSTFKGCDFSKFDGNENSGGNDNSSSNVTSPTLYEIKTLKSEQYSALFETACEIEYYTSHKNILPTESTSKSSSKKGKLKSRGLKQSLGKSHSATSSPVKHSDNVISSLYVHKKNNTSDTDTASTSNEFKSGETSLVNEGINEILKSPNFEVLEESETQSNTKLRQSSRSSSHSLKDGNDEIWEQSDKEAPYYESGGQTLPTSSDAKQVIETTC